MARSRTRVLNSSLAAVSGLPVADFDQDADLRTSMDVVADETTAGDFVNGEARNNDVFAELGDFGFDHFANGVGSAPIF